MGLSQRGQKETDLATHDGLALELGPWKQHLSFVPTQKVQILKGNSEAELFSFFSVCEGGELFTWGWNTHGQLGVGSQTTLTHKPQLVERLKGVPLAQIAAGGAHSTTVSLSGAVYSWGKNSFGQLGLGDMKGKEGEHQEGVFLVSEFTKLLFSIVKLP